MATVLKKEASDDWTLGMSERSTCVRCSGSVSIEVKANSKAEAVMKAKEQLDRMRKEIDFMEKQLEFF